MTWLFKIGIYFLKTGEGSKTIIPKSGFYSNNYFDQEIEYEKLRENSRFMVESPLNSTGQIFSEEKNFGSVRLWYGSPKIQI